MTLNVKAQKRNKGHQVLQLTGRLDAEAVPVCEAAVRPWLQPSTKVLILDLGGLEYICSLGLRMLMQTRQTLAARHARLLMTNLQPQILRVFELAAMLSKTEVFDSVESADIFLEALENKIRLAGSDVDD